MLGGLMKLQHWPGGSFLLIVFTGLFVLLVVPFNYASSVANPAQKGMKQFGALAVVLLLLGMLFFMQFWAGAFILLIAGIITMLVFIVMYFTRSRPAEHAEPMVTPHVIFVFVFVAALTIGCVSAINKSNYSEEHMLRFVKEETACDSLQREVSKQLNDFTANQENSDSVRNSAFALYNSATDLIEFINKTELEFVSRLNDEQTIPAGAPIEKYIHRPADYDMATHYFLGNDPENPTGKGMEIYRYLKIYRNESLHPEVDFFVPLNAGFDQNVQWVKDNYYHTPTADVLMQLTLVKENILRSVQQSLQRKLFVK